MTIYVGPPLWPYRGQLYCHMSSDESLDELHTFAQSVGLKREWFQRHRLVDHYDCGPKIRSIALKKGAISVSDKEIIRKCKNSKRGKR